MKMELGGTSKPKALGKGPRSRLAQRVAMRFSTIRTVALPTARQSAIAKSVAAVAASSRQEQCGRFTAQMNASAAPRCANAAAKSFWYLKRPKASFAAPLVFTSMAPQPGRASCKTRATSWSRCQEKPRGQRSTEHAAVTGCWNIGSSCSKSWGASLAQEKTYITSMGNAMTTGLKTLNYGKSRNHAVFAQLITTAQGALALRSLADNASGIFAL